MGSTAPGAMEGLRRWPSGSLVSETCAARGRKRCRVWRGVPSGTEALEFNFGYSSHTSVTATLMLNPLKECLPATVGRIPARRPRSESNCC